MEKEQIYRMAMIGPRDFNVSSAIYLLSCGLPAPTDYIDGRSMFGRAPEYLDVYKTKVERIRIELLQILKFFDDFEKEESNWDLLTVHPIIMLGFYAKSQNDQSFERVKNSLTHLFSRPSVQTKLVVLLGTYFLTRFLLTVFKFGIRITETF
jgi:hypothetical protein